MRISDWSSDVCSSDLAIRGFEVEDEFPGLGRRIFKLDAREISATGNQAGRLSVAFEDVTESRLLERHKDILAAELSHRIKNSLQRSEEHTSELQSLMRISYAVFCLTKKKRYTNRKQQRQAN